MRSNAVTTPLLEGLRAALAGRTRREAPSGSYVPSAVLILLYPSGGDHKVLLHRRSQRVVHHKGDIAFPGGVQEDGESLLETALRETHEEVGVDPADVEVLGRLDDTPTSANYLITPYVGTIPSPYEFRPNSEEVDALLEAPVSGLLEPSNRREDARLVDGELKRIPCFAHDGHLVVGATAMILADLVELMERSERRKPAN